MGRCSCCGCNNPLVTCVVNDTNIPGATGASGATGITSARLTGATGINGATGATGINTNTTRTFSYSIKGATEAYIQTYVNYNELDNTDLYEPYGFAQWKIKLDENGDADDIWDISDDLIAFKKKQIESSYYYSIEDEALIDYNEKYNQTRFYQGYSILINASNKCGSASCSKSCSFGWTAFLRRNLDEACIGPMVSQNQYFVGIRESAQEDLRTNYFKKQNSLVRLEWIVYFDDSENLSDADLLSSFGDKILFDGMSVPGAEIVSVPCLSNFFVYGAGYNSWSGSFGGFNSNAYKGRAIYNFIDIDRKDIKENYEITIDGVSMCGVPLTNNQIDRFKSSNLFSCADKLSKVILTREFYIDGYEFETGNMYPPGSNDYFFSAQKYKISGLKSLNYNKELDFYCLLQMCCEDTKQLWTYFDNCNIIDCRDLYYPVDKSNPKWWCDPFATNKDGVDDKKSFFAGVAPCGIDVSNTGYEIKNDKIIIDSAFFNDTSNGYAENWLRIEGFPLYQIGDISAYNLFSNGYNGLFYGFGSPLLSSFILTKVSGAIFSGKSNLGGFLDDYTKYSSTPPNIGNLPPSYAQYFTNLQWVNALNLTTNDNYWTISPKRQLGVTPNSLYYNPATITCDACKKPDGLFHCGDYNLASINFISYFFGFQRFINSFNILESGAKEAVIDGQYIYDKNNSAWNCKNGTCSYGAFTKDGQAVYVSGNKDDILFSFPSCEINNLIWRKAFFYQIPFYYDENKQLIPAQYIKIGEATIRYE